MVELLLWRHAKTERGGPGLPDHERKLVPRGRNDAHEMGTILEERGIRPQVVLCSDAARARETADLGMKAMTGAPERVDLRDLYDADAFDIPSIVSVYGGGASRVMIVGHNPTMAEYASQVAGTPVEMKTGALAVIELDADACSRVDRSTPARLREVILPSKRG